jgi:hypothetical protein
MRENSIYTITPPDMHLTDNGPTITVVSTNDKFLSKVETLHERLFKTVPVSIYHCGGQVNESNMAWLISVMRFSDNVFVDLDTANDLGILCAIFSDSSTIYINKEKKRNDIAKLFNSVNAGFNVYEDLQDYFDLVLDSLE